MSHPPCWCWDAKKQRKRSQCCFSTDFSSPEVEASTFDTHSEVHLVVVGYWRCCQRKTESYGWSLAGSASPGPERSQK